MICPHIQNLCLQIDFQRKLKVNRSINRYKLRLVAKGSHKRKTNYFCTYTLVTYSTSIIVLIALAAIHNWYVYLMDVKTAYLKMGNYYLYTFSLLNYQKYYNTLRVYQSSTLSWQNVSADHQTVSCRLSMMTSEG